MQINVSGNPFGLPQICLFSFPKLKYLEKNFKKHPSGQYKTRNPVATVRFVSADWAI